MMEDFQVLSVIFSTEKTSGDASPLHRLFCKKHAVRQNSQLTPNDRTLFTLGWPPYTTTQAVEELFSRAGHVTSVYLQSSPGPVDPKNSNSDAKGFKVGYVVFSRSSEVTAALCLCSTDHSSLSTPISCTVPATGVQKWAREYLLSRPTAASLEKAAEVGVALYDRQQEEAAQARERAGQPDEEGWVTVTRKTPRPVIEDPERRKKKKKKQQPVGLNVYPWQQRESQREQVAELRKRFEEEKQKVALMKARRKFKPY